MPRVTPPLEGFDADAYFLGGLHLRDDGPVVSAGCGDA